MSAPKQTQRLERNLYRGRRLIDAVRLLPWLGLILFILPALFAPEAPEQASSTAFRLLYFIAAWLLMICLALIIAHSLKRQDRATPQDNSPPQDRGPRNGHQPSDTTW